MYPRNFICLAAVSRGIYQIRCGICQILPRKTVGPTNQVLTIYPSPIKNICKAYWNNGTKILSCRHALYPSAYEPTTSPLFADVLLWMTPNEMVKQGSQLEPIKLDQLYSDLLFRQRQIHSLRFQTNF